MRILVTGGAGFIGSHLVRHFVSAGHDVTIADRFTYAGKARRLQDVLGQVTLLLGDLAQGDLPARCVEAAPEVLLHTAAETHVDRSISDPTSFILTNVLGTSRLLDAFARHGKHPKTIVYSTDEVYGAQSNFEYTSCMWEDDHFNPSNAYSASKVGVEAVCQAYRRTFQFPICIVRPCNVYGRGQHPEKAIPKWTAQALAGKPVTLYNDGKGFRDWMHTADHCRAIGAILAHWTEARPPRLVVNLAREDWRTDQQVWESLAIMLNLKTPPHIQYVPGRPGHDHGYAMHGDIMSQDYLCRPGVDFQDGLLDMVQWAQANPYFWASDAIPADAWRWANAGAMDI